jgi:hypothetical protein
MQCAAARTALFVLVWGLCAAACGSEEAGDGNLGRAAEPSPASGAAACEASKAKCAEFGDERPARSSEHSAAYDPERAELIVFGGTDSIPVACALGGPVRFVGETWIYSDPCRGWARVTAPGPSAAGRHMATWGDGNVWVFGGRFREQESTGEYELYDDLFRFEVATRTWHEVEVAGERPSPRVNGALAWDEERDRLWLFGGNESSSGASYAPLADVWSFDPDDARWTLEKPEGRAPPARLFHAALYDAQRDGLVIFGGADASAFSGTARYFRDLWALSLPELQWVQLHAGGANAQDVPEGRFWPGLVHDRGRDAYLLFGGHDDQQLGNRNDTWRFDPEALAWELVAEGDLLQGEARAVCDFPPDFTDVALDAPERRSAHSLVWSEPCKHALLFGGKTDCGAIDDVWSFDGQRWREELAATEGESCLRWREDPSECGDLCF